MTAADLWRSRDMSYCNMTVKRDALSKVLKEVTKLNKVQFIDETPQAQAFNRSFAKDLVAITDVMNRLHFFRTNIEKELRRPKAQITDINIATLTAIDTYLEQQMQLYKSTSSEYMALEAQYSGIIYKNAILQNLKNVYEYSESAAIFTDNEYTSENRDLGDDSLGTLVYILPRKLAFMVQRTLFRTTYGNVVFQQFEIPDKVLNDEMDIVAAYITGEEAARRSVKAIQTFGLEHIVLHKNDNITNMRNRAQEEAGRNTLQLQHQKMLLKRVLEEVSAHIDHFTYVLETERTVTHASNLFADNGAMLSCHCWIPVDSIQYVKTQLLEVDTSLGNNTTTQLDTNLFTKEQPPTFFQQSQFTEVFCAIVNSYGTPGYKEINPAFFYIYHFPFTYSLMFGDIGHGIINCVCGLLMIIFQKKLSKIHNDMFELIFFGRYIIFLMSLFSIFTGVMYNDTFALGFDLWGTKYSWKEDVETGVFHAIYKNMEDPKVSPVYPFGIDPFWHWASNSMVFLNSYKMKLSVVIGISQMIFGLIVKIINLIHLKKYIQIFLVWIPEFFFMACFFGYMLFSIILKWLKVWPPESEMKPPGLINMLISVFLQPGSLGEGSQLFNDAQFQINLQYGIFIISVIMIVWLAVAEPVYEIIQIKKHPAEHVGQGVGDVVVQQVIHTIEYVLSCISHTASYLRLWALSLAHAQLAEVFFDQLLTLSFNTKFSDNATVNSIIGGISLFVTFGGWFGASIAILCGMEALSAFLHCLRLAWIEFNSKFFVADGYPFDPLQLVVPESIEITIDLAKSD